MTYPAQASLAWSRYVLLLWLGLAPASAAGLISGCAAPQAPPGAVPGAVRTETASPPLPLDPKVTTGTLENGLTFFLQQHQSDEKRAHLMLVVQAGSLYEEDDQRGFAHFVEHMAFNGTRRF